MSVLVTETVLLAATARRAQVKMAQADAQDFEALFAEHWGRVNAVLLRLVGDPAEAEDLSLEVFWRLYHKPPKDRDPMNLVGWLYRVATNLGYNALRSGDRRDRYENEAGLEAMANRTSLDPAARAESDLRRQEVRRVLAGMKSRSARLLILRHSGFSYTEIAAVLKLSPNSIGTLLARAEREFESAFIAAYGKDF